MVANLPYYVTTPLITKILDESTLCESMTVMVQEEVAERFCAIPATPDYGAITAVIALRASAKILKRVPREMFTPRPNVDSAVVKITLDKKKLDGYDKELVHHLIRAAFAMRRKTLVNNLSVAFSISKDEATKKVTDAGFAPLIRGEALSLENFLTLSRQFEN